jgi:large subunit ribosomal protein L10
VRRPEKEAVIADMVARLGRAKALVLTDFSGLKVEQMTSLRDNLRKQELQYLVIKNTLLQRAAQGTPAEELVKNLAGPNGVAISYDEPVELAKVLSDFAKDNEKFQIKDGLLEGKVISAEDVAALAKLPSREVLLAQLFGTMNGVARNFVSVLAAVIRDLMNVLKAIEEQKAETSA